MLLLLVGIALVVLKLGGWTAVAHWSWWAVLAPFAGAALWWAFADATGITRRRAAAREARRRQQRRETQYTTLDPLNGPPTRR